jgi:hypothetical protein
MLSHSQTLIIFILTRNCKFHQQNRFLYALQSRIWSYQRLMSRMSTYPLDVYLREYHVGINVL